MTDADDDSSTGRTLAIVAVGLGAVVVLGVVAILVLAVVLSGFVLQADSTTGGSVPQAQFEGSYENQAVTITHDGGEQIDPANVIVVVDGTERGTWSQLGETSDPIGAGATVTVEAVEPGDAVELVYVAGENRRALLYNFAVPANRALSTDGETVPLLGESPSSLQRGPSDPTSVDGAVARLA